MAVYDVPGGPSDNKDGEIAALKKKLAEAEAQLQSRQSGQAASRAQRKIREAERDRIFGSARTRR